MNDKVTNGVNSDDDNDRTEIKSGSREDQRQRAIRCRVGRKTANCISTENEPICILIQTNLARVALGSS